MHFYRVYSDSSSGESIAWTGDFAQAKRVTHTFKHVSDLYVDLLDLPIDKKAIIDYLNVGAPETKDLPQPLRSWMITPRGGLKEVSPPNPAEKPA